jgi:predicted nucleotidyltransferase
MAVVTPFPALNGLLRELVVGAKSVLGANFLGAYLQGSFAVGDADEFSDVDFIVVTHDSLTSSEQDGLQRLHARLHELDDAWGPHLEGSYVPKDQVRRLDASRRPFFYLDNGARAFAWDNHDNTAVVRWSLREHGVVLAGPHPADLIDPVSSDELRKEASRAMTGLDVWSRESFERYQRGDGLAFSRWKQPYLVLSLCRVRQTLELGVVSSKRQAAEWALSTLDPRWASLIERALGDRADPWQRVHEPAEPEAVAETMAFVAYTISLAGELHR